MARGETRAGYENLQRPGQPTGAASKRGRGGAIVPLREYATVVLPGTSAATSSNYGIFFTAPAITRQYWATNPSGGAEVVAEWEVTQIYARFATAGTDSGSVTCQVQKVPSGTAAGSGTNLLTSTGINLKGTINTNQIFNDASGNLNDGQSDSTPYDLLSNIQLNPGDSLALVPSGTLTAVAHLEVTVELRRI